MAVSDPNVQSVLAAQYLGAGDNSAPASSPSEAAATGTDMGPITLTAVYPSITPPKTGTVADTATGWLCDFNLWVQNHALMAAAGLVGLYLLLKPKKGARK